MFLGSDGCLCFIVTICTCNDGCYLVMLIEMRLREVNCCPIGKVADTPAAFLS
jgi:hypothetical protein